MSTKTLQITLQHQREDRWPVSATLNHLSEAPLHVEGELNLEKDWETALLELSLQAEDYGIYLGKALFHSDILELTKEALTGEDSVQLFLIIESKRLKHLRWERLYFLDDGDQWTSLAQHQRLILSYYVPSLLTRQYPVVSRPDLEAFTFIASPVDEYNGYKPFDAEHFANITKQSLGKIESQKLIYDAKDSNWETFKETINKQHFPILHIVAHGMYWEKPNKTETFLIFLDKDQKPELISSEEFIDTLRYIDKLPNLIFLSSCETATPKAAKGSREHFARRLIDELATPAVIAMSDKVSVETAEILTTHFYDHLYQEGKVDRALAKAGLDLLNRGDRYLPVLYQSLGNRPLFSIVTEALEQLSQERLEYGIEKFEPLIEERAPYFKTQFETLLQQLDTEHPEHKILHELDQLCYEITEISFAALAQKEDPPEYNSECPFPGMQAFRATEKGIDYRKFFFGREKKVAELVDLVSEKPVFAIKGASGSGKSSIVFAGILPAMEKLAKEKGEKLQTVTMTPGCQTITSNTNKTPKENLQRIVGKLNPEQETIIYIDQFEELFTSCQYKDTKKQKRIRKAFIDELLQLPELHKNWKVILTIRADFVGECSDYENLRLVTQHESDLLPQMTPDELRTAIEKQANKVGLIFEDHLLHQILDEVDGEPGAMPLLQHLLWILWERRCGRYLRQAEFDKIGGVTKAISETADNVYNSYEKGGKEQKYLRNIFIRLTRPDKERHDDDESNYRDTRQRVNRQSLFPNHVDPKIIEELIKRLADERLVVTKENEVEIAHESLIHYWGKLKSWLYDRSLILVRQEVADATQAWQQIKKPDLLQHRGSRIETIDGYKNNELLYLNDDEEKYLTACKNEDKKQKRNSRYFKIFSFTTLAFFGVAVLVAYFAINLKNKANDQLADQYFKKGVELRDNKWHETERAIQYFAKALDITSYTNKRNDILFSHLELKQINFKLETLFDHHRHVIGATPFNDNQRILTWSDDGSTYIWNANTGELIHRYKLHHELPVKGAILFSAGQRILTWSGKSPSANSRGGNGTVRVWDVSTGMQIINPIHHEGAVMGASLFDNERRILTWSRDKTLQVWDTNTGELLVNPMQHEGAVLGATMFAREQRILSWGTDGTARIWEANSGELIGKPIQHQSQVRGAQLFANEQRILTWSVAGGVHIWDVVTGTLIGKTFKHDKPINGAKLFSDEKRVLTWGTDGTVRIWNADTYEVIGKPMQHKNPVWGVKLLANEQYLLTWGGGVSVRLWDMNAQKQVGVPLLHDLVNGLAVTVDEKRILSWGRDGTVRMWSINPYIFDNKYTYHKVSVKNTVFSDAQRVMTWSTPPSVSISNPRNGTVTVWDINTGKQIIKPILHKGVVRGARLFSNQERILTWSSDGTARVWDARSGNPISRSMQHQKSVWGAELFSNEKRIFTWGEDGISRVWNADTGKLISRTTQHKKWVKSLLFSDEQRILTWSGDGTARVWDANSGKPMTTIMKHGRRMITNALLSNDELTVLTWGLGVARIWDAKTGKQIGKAIHHTKGRGGGNAILFSNNQHILTWNGDTAHIWDIDSGIQTTKLISHKDNIYGARLFSNEKRLLTWSADGTARVWDTNNGVAISKIMQHKKRVIGAKLFLNETRVLTWSEDGTARVWNANSGEPITEPLNHEKSVNGASLLFNETIVLTWSDDGSARVWDVATGTAISAIMHHNSPILGSIAFANDRRFLSWSADGTSRVWKLPKIPKENSYVLSLEENIESGVYLNSTGDIRFLTVKQWNSCKHIYDQFRECNGTATNLACKFNRKIKWPLQKFFEQLPTVDDCLNNGHLKIIEK